MVLKKSPVKKSPVKKSPVKKSPVKKSPVKKSPVKKSPVKKLMPVLKKSPRGLQLCVDDNCAVVTKKSAARVLKKSPVKKVAVCKTARGKKGATVCTVISLDEALGMLKSKSTMTPIDRILDSIDKGQSGGSRMLSVDRIMEQFGRL
jgi:hypothetical protein